LSATTQSSRVARPHRSVGSGDAT